MSDYTPCEHGTAAYCDICSPGWEAKIHKDDALDAIYTRGFENGCKVTAEKLKAERDALAAAVRDASRQLKYPGCNWHEKHAAALALAKGKP